MVLVFLALTCKTDPFSLIFGFAWFTSSYTPVSTTPNDSCFDVFCYFLWLMYKRERRKNGLTQQNIATRSRRPGINTFCNESRILEYSEKASSWLDLVSQNIQEPLTFD